MTLEEIKRSVSMDEILGRYGIRKNRNGFCKCPFHNDKHASMKVYRNNSHCYSCNWDGSVIDFVMGMDNVSFKDAFIILGGDYERDPKKRREILRKVQIEREKREKEKHEEMLRKQLNIARIDAERVVLAFHEPLSDAWCEAYNGLQLDLYKHSIINQIPY